MDILPLDLAPRPRYWLMVIAFPFGVPSLPSTLAVHWSWRTTPSAPLISSQNMGPILGAAWARMPYRLLRYRFLSVVLGSVQAA